jgi:electron transport complex protein RnfA
MAETLSVILLATVLTNNFVLSYFLGICPFLGVSNQTSSAVGMGLATTFVMTITAPVTWVIYHLILVPLHIEYLQYVSFIMVIAALVQFVEMYLHKVIPALHQSLGMFLPLITTNCAILGLALFMVLREYSFIEAIVFGLGAGIGFSIALLLMAGLREGLEFADIPAPFRGGPITLIMAGILALAFMGFGGMTTQ